MSLNPRKNKTVRKNNARSIDLLSSGRPSPVRTSRRLEKKKKKKMNSIELVFFSQEKYTLLLIDVSSSFRIEVFPSI